MTEKNPVEAIAQACGGKVEAMGSLPDGSGWGTVSLPLPKNHWLYRPGSNVPPMPFRLGSDEFGMWATREKFPPEGGRSEELAQVLSRDDFARAIRAAGKYALRCATMNGSEPDYSPDAVLQNLVVGMIGYWTGTGLSNEAFMNPPRPFDFEEEKP